MRSLLRRAPARLRCPA